MLCDYNRLMLFRKIPFDELNNFYQAKFDYYRIVSAFSAILMAILEMSYFISDCQLFGRIAYETIIPRFSIVVPLAIFLILYPRIKSYKAGAWLYYLMPHASMWCTIWTIFYLDNKDYAREGFIIMHFAFLAIGLAMPLIYHIPFHALLIANIVISNTFNHYDSYQQMITLALPIFVGVCVMHYILENSYADHYLTLKQLELSFITDQLTGAKNRYILKDLVDNDTERLETTSPMCIAMLDIDHFKQVNDTYGHATGDMILCNVSKRIMTNLFDDDTVIRWGGEEFVILLNDYNYDKAYEFCDKLRQEIEAEDNGVCPITISIGLSEYDPSDTYHDAINKSDKALYKAKENGRNQVVKYTDL